MNANFRLLEYAFISDFAIWNYVFENCQIVFWKVHLAIVLFKIIYNLLTFVAGLFISPRRARAFPVCGLRSAALPATKRPVTRSAVRARLWSWASGRRGAAEKRRR
jgi:hypothetical protein